MEDSYVNLIGEPINQGDFYYSLDYDDYVETPSPEERYVDNERGVCTNSRDKLILFYLVNDIPCQGDHPNTTDVERLSNDDIHELSLFSLSGLFAKVRIISVFSATTIDLIVFVPSEFMSEYRLIYLGYRRYPRRIAISHEGDIGFFIRLRCTLRGVESYLNTPVKDRHLREQLAREYLTSFCNTCGNIVYAYFHNTNFVTLYSDKDRIAPSINDDIISHRHKDVGAIVRKSEILGD